MNYYFGKVPKLWREEGLTPGFNNKYYFRFQILPGQEEVRFEDNCNRVVPISYEDLKKMKKTLKKVIKEIKRSLWL